MTDPAMPQRPFLDVSTTGGLSTLQDLGRPGYAHLGVPMSGAADRSALMLANRLVGNSEDTAGIEVTFGGLSFTLRGVDRQGGALRGDVLMVVTGAPCPVLVDSTPVGTAAAFVVRDGHTVTLGAPTHQLRSYLAVRGGIDAEPILGSRSTDTLSDLGPAPLSAGDRLPIGTAQQAWPATTEAPADMAAPATGEIPTLLAYSGPRAEALVDADVLFDGEWVVSSSSNRVGVRLDRPVDGAHEIPRIRSGRSTLPSEGVALGSVQIPPGGQPVIFLADHPVTGGYPVAAVLSAESIDRAAQLVPGQRVRLRR